MQRPREIDIPAHVPMELVVDYDLYRGQIYSETGDLHDGLNRINERIGQGIFWTWHSGGHWLINDYAMLAEASRSPDLFSSTEMTLPPVPEEPKLIPLFLDPPDHGVFRAPLMQEFSPRRMRALEADIREFAAELIDTLVDKGQCDFVEAIAEPLPIIIFMRLVGMPVDRLHEFRSWIFDMLSDDDDRRMSAYARISLAMGELIRERQSEPRNDLISRLLDVEIQGRKVSFDEMQAYCMMLFAAGLDTVANALSFGMNFMAKRSDLQRRFHANPGEVPAAVEEMLRLFGVPMPTRTATRDFVFHGAPIKSGERVLLMIPAANLDPDVFSDPFTFDVARENRTHIGFNVGPHRCIGMNLARIELQTFWQEWFARMPEVRLDPEKPVVTRAGLTLAIQQMPLLWQV